MFNPQTLNSIVIDMQVKSIYASKAKYQINAGLLKITFFIMQCILKIKKFLNSISN